MFISRVLRNRPKGASSYQPLANIRQGLLDENMDYVKTSYFLRASSLYQEREAMFSVIQKEFRAASETPRLVLIGMWVCLCLKK